MPLVALIIALALIIAAAALWRLDARSRQSAPPVAEVMTPPAPVETTEVTDTPAEPEEPRTGFSLPGAGRRERRAWAQEHGFDFAKTDDYLNDEWSRGAASNGAPVRDVVSGVTDGAEVYLLDLGTTPVMAVRRGVESDLVIDFRRGETPTDASEDLLAAGEVAGFSVFSGDHAVAQRFIDDRVIVALETLPAAVSAVWFEGGWVLAELTRTSHAGDWDQTIAPLTLLAYAARTLPPRGGMAAPLLAEDVDPTRVLPEKPAAVGVAKQLSEEPVKLLIARPEEPMELPSRARGEAHGVVKPRALGGDDVEVIATGESAPSAADGTRVIRQLGTSSIFEDLAKGLGRDPLADHDANHKKENPNDQSHS